MNLTEISRVYEVDFPKWKRESLHQLKVDIFCLRAYEAGHRLYGFGEKGERRERHSAF